MKEILVIMTGGTIGSSVSDNVLDVHLSNKTKLIDMYKQTYKDDTAFEIIQPANLLSENLCVGDWAAIYNSIRSANHTQYAGIIITHGSDALAYTSSMLGYLLSYIKIPVVVTASNTPLGEAGSNGLENFRSAVLLIKSKILNGVFTVYQNNKKENIVYLSTRITSADYFTDQFGDFSGSCFACIKKDKLVLCPSPLNPSKKEINANTSPDFGPLQFRNEITMIHSYPGLNYDNIRIGPKTKAVVNILYHSSTACVFGGEKSILRFLERCKQQNIDFYIAALKKDATHLYATTRAILDAGAKPLYNISPESAYTKLCLAYNQEILSVSDLLDRNLFFEIV